MLELMQTKCDSEGSSWHTESGSVEKWIIVDVVEMLYESTAVLDIQQECLLFKPFFDWLFCYLHSKVS